MTEKFTAKNTKPAKFSMARPPRFFISPSQISGSRILLSGEDVRHIGTVLRMKAGDRLVLSDGQGAEYHVAITGVQKTGIETEILGRENRAAAHPRVILGQALPKFDKMDLIVQKATELGVASVVPLVTERTIAKVRDEEKRISRWQKICREAAMQCDRHDIPQVQPIRTLPEFIRMSHVDPETLLLLPWEQGTVPIKSVLQRSPGVKQIVVLIGPEGGLSSREAESAKDNGFHVVSLGRNILRTETAAFAVLSMILYETGTDPQTTG